MKVADMRTRARKRLSVGRETLRILTSSHLSTIEGRGIDTSTYPPTMTQDAGCFMSAQDPCLAI